MTPAPEKDQRLTDQEVDRELRDLLAPAAAPRPYAGFEQRLARAIANDRENEVRTRRLRRVLAAYWLAVAAASVAILWHAQELLAAGPGLWLTVGGGAALGLAAFSFRWLTTLPLARRASRG